MTAESLQGVVVFVRVAESRSFTEAAKHLGISPSGVSKAISRLEDRLGTRLVHRTTRSINLTHEGSAYYESCRSILDELQAAENAVSEGRALLTGKLRIQMPLGLGQQVMVPLIVEFAELHPELTFDLELSDRESDLASEGLDFAIRINELRSVSCVARHLCNLRFATVASPKYLEKYGEPRTPEELDRHRCLVFYLPHLRRYREWLFSSAGNVFSHTPAGVISLNDAQAVLDAVIAGAGIANVVTYVAHNAVRSGQLRVILPRYTAVGPPVTLVYLAHRHLAARVQAFVDFVRTKITAPPKWDELFP
ncbi:MAG: LysR family transcriptional regulator [Burkholderiales bacterium]|nr:LysR family transcriptional regulator [Burkholderiales bacterium]